jgi:hypothetical protein
MNIDTQTVEGQAQEKDRFIGWHVVAFLDLLGQQDALSKITALPNVENEEDVATFKQKVTELYRPLYALETFFKAGIRPFIAEGTHERQLPSFEQELLKQFRSTPVFYRQFSDSLIVHVPIRNDLGKFQCHTIYGVLIATAVTVLSCLVHSWVIRGGIDLGLAMDIKDGELYGPALARAHRLESRVAQYPRIVVGEELVQYLRMVQAQKVTTPDEAAHAGLATRSLGLLAVDDDGFTFLDWLGRDMRNSFQERRELVVNAYNFIIQECNKHKEKRNSKLGFRYSLLRNYVESRLPEWGIAFQSE